MIIRKARLEDADAIARFIFMAEGEMIPFFTGHEDRAGALCVLREFILAPVPCRYSLDIALVAEEDGVTAGAAFAFPADSQPELDLLILASVNARGYNLKELFFEGEAGTYYLSTMAVDPRFRNRGIGTALMAAAEVEGARLGFAKASLLVETEKEKARALYERLGYGVSKTVVIGGFRYHLMGRHLAPASTV